MPIESVFYSLRSCFVHCRNRKAGLGKVWNLGGLLKSRYHSLNSEYTVPFTPYFMFGVISTIIYISKNLMNIQDEKKMKL